MDDSFPREDIAVFIFLVGVMSYWYYNSQFVKLNLYFGNYISVCLSVCLSVCPHPLYFRSYLTSFQ